MYDRSCQLEMTQNLKVPKDRFERVIRALLNTPPMPMTDILRKRERKPGAKKSGPKKRS
jgi:hypothetical protein